MITKLSQRDYLYIKALKELIQQHNKEIDSIFEDIKKTLQVKDEDTDINDWLCDVFLNDLKDFDQHFKEFSDYANLEIEK